MPQPPQFCTLFVVAVSHPFFGLASQLPKPAAQVMPHTPALQNARPFVVSQPNPQPPQFLVLVSMFVSQPFDATPSQSANGEMHDEMAHDPDVHVVLAFGSTQS